MRKRILQKIDIYRKLFTTKNIIKLSRKSFLKNVITVASGTAIAQIITMIFSPILTRLYGPEAIGILGVFTSIIAVTTPIAALTYPIGIVLPKEDTDSLGLIRLSLYISFIMSSITLLLLVFFGEVIVHALQIEEITPYLFFIPLFMIFAAGFQVTQQWLIRKKRFNINAKVAVIQSLIVNISQAGIGLFNPSAMILILVATLGKGIHTLLLGWGANLVFHLRSSSKQKNRNQIKTPLTYLARKYIDFPMYRAPEVFINAISQTLPILFLTAFFGPASAGFYFIGKKVLEMPSQLIGNSVGDVFYPRISEAAHNNENVTKLLRKATFILAVIGLVPFGIIIFFGPLMFSFIFGSDWLIAGQYARWIAVWSFFGFINIPSVKTLPVIGAQRFHLIFSVITIIARLLALGIGGYLLRDDILAVALFSITGAILNSILVFITYTKSKSFTNER